MDPIIVDNKKLNSIEDVTLYIGNIILQTETLKSSRHSITIQVVDIKAAFEIAYNLKAQDIKQIVGEIECYSNCLKVYKRPPGFFIDNKVTVYF